MSAIRKGGVIAAGEGSRLKGGAKKPMRVVAGAPLLAHALRRFRTAGIREVALIFREADREPADFARREFSDLDLRIVFKTTAASGESFREVLRALGPGRALLTTVDSILAEEDFERFLARAEELPQSALVLAVTRRVDDESPLWARMEEDGRITELGGSSGNCVTAGLYVVPEDFAARTAGVAGKSPRLRRLLCAYLEAGGRVFGALIPDVIDVDRPEDVAAAEALHRTGGEA